MGFCVPVYFLFLLGKLPVIPEHPVIKYTQYRLREWMDEIEYEIEEMCPGPVACRSMTGPGILICLQVINDSINRGMCRA